MCPECGAELLTMYEHAEECRIGIALYGAWIEGFHAGDGDQLDLGDNPYAPAT